MRRMQADNGRMTIERPGALWVEADKTSPRLTGLGWDTEGTGRHRINLLKSPVELRFHRNGNSVMPQVRFDAPDPWTARYNLVFANGSKMIFGVDSRPDAFGLRMAWEGDLAAAFDRAELVFPFEPETAMTSIISERWT